MMHLLLICVASLTLYHVCAVCDVEMISREEWGAKTATGSETMNMPVPHIFIHHTATGSCSSLDNCSRIMRSMQNFHMGKGWHDIGYNFVIGGDGRVYIGRGWDKVGAHTYGFNRNSVAFSLIGNYGSNSPPENMLATTKKMIECAKNESYVTNNFKLHGHRDGTCTECPGQALYDIIKTWDKFEGGPLPGFKCSG